MFPTKVLQLMSYQKTTVKAHRTYGEQGWVTYDYRRTKSLDWGVIDFNLYNETLLVRPRQFPGANSVQANSIAVTTVTIPIALFSSMFRVVIAGFLLNFPIKLLPYVSNSTVTIKIIAS